MLSFGHTLSHNKYVWHGGVEADHVVISGYSLALEKGTLVYKVTNYDFMSLEYLYNKFVARRFINATEQLEQ